LENGEDTFCVVWISRGGGVVINANTTHPAVNKKIDASILDRNWEGI